MKITFNHGFEYDTYHSTLTSSGNDMISQSIIKKIQKWQNSQFADFLGIILIGLMACSFFVL